MTPQAVLRAAAFVGRPLLMEETAAARFGAGLAQGFDGAPEMRQPAGWGAAVPQKGGAPYRVEDGVAILDVRGGLANRAAAGAALGLLSYERFKAQLEAAIADMSVRGVVLDVDSAGGEAAGAIEAGAAVRRAATRKPVVAFVDGLAASAAYAISAGATRIVAQPSSQIGSIGVALLHLDETAALARAGVRPTLLFAGAAKVDGSRLAALEPAAHARLQGRVDEIYALFVASVAAHRGLSEQAVRATQAGLFLGAKAVAAGLADEVGGRAAAMALIRKLGPRRAAPRPATRAPAAVAQGAARPVAPFHPGSAHLTATPMILAERNRIQAILAAPEAVGYGELALRLACETALPADDARAILAAVARA